MPTARSDAMPPRLWQRRLMVGIVVMVGLHSVALALWLSPANPARDSIGTSALASYVEPYFEQSWDGLDPRAQRVDESFRIRANVTTSVGKKKMRVTPWLDLTKVDNSSMRHDLDQARVRLIARRLATNLNAAMYQLEPAQRRLVKTNYITTPIERLRERLLEAGPDRDAVQTYMSYDQMATQFASMYARAKWGGDDTILEVQYLVGRRVVPDYADRGSTTLKDVDYLWFPFGYRKAYRGSYDVQVIFDSYVKK